LKRHNFFTAKNVFNLLILKTLIMANSKSGQGNRGGGGSRGNQGGGRSSGRGFAGMSDEEQRKISSKGGRASHGGGRSNSGGGRSGSSRGGSSKGRSSE
jgi:hypothetical protein